MKPEESTMISVPNLDIAIVWETISAHHHQWYLPDSAGVPMPGTKKKNVRRTAVGADCEGCESQRRKFHQVGMDFSYL